MTKVKVKCQVMFFLVNASPPKPLDVAASNFAMTWRVQGNILCDIDPKVKDQIMYFLVNAYPKSLDVATSNFAVL